MSTPGTAMDVSIADKLHELLTRQYAGHEELLRALQAQQQALRAFDVRRPGERCTDAAICSPSGSPNWRRPRAADRAGRAAVGAGTDMPRATGRSRLLAISAGLRKLAGQTAALSRVNDSAVRKMLNHFHAIYQLMATAGRPSGYGKSGQATAPGGAAFLVDAVA